MGKRLIPGFANLYVEEDGTLVGILAAGIPIADAGEYFAVDNVEAALQELGAAGGHDPVTLGAQDPAGALSLVSQQLSQSLVEKIGPTHILGTATWGASSKKLLNYVPYTNSNYLLARAALTNDTDFLATIATLPGGATLTYNAPSSGDEKCIDPYSATVLAKVVLHNTTRGDSALIDDADISTNTITLTANVPGSWQVGDTITARSQTNTVTWGGTYFFDVDVSGTFGATVAVLAVDMQFYESSVAGEAGYLHPYEAYSSTKQAVLSEAVGNVYMYRTALIPLISQRFTVAWTASGAGTATITLRIIGYFEEAAT